MKLEQIWRDVYNSRRYLAEISAEELLERAGDILLNMRVLANDATIGNHPLTGEGQYWLALWTHVLEENRLRNSMTEPELREALEPRLAIPDDRLTFMKRASEAVCNRLPVAPPYVVLYGKRPDLERFMNNGEITTETNSDSMPVLRFCAMLKSHIFLAFGANTCLITSRPKELTDRLAEAAASQIDTPPLFGNVHYIDPFSNVPCDANPLLCEHFGKSYQHEYRIIWPQKQAAPLQLEAGPLDDICELLVVD